MRRIASGSPVTALLWILLIAGLVTGPTRWVEAAGDSSTPSRIASALVEFTNVDRARLGRTALRADDALMRAAQLHADQMARVGQMAHVLDMTPLPRPEDRLAAANYRWRTYGENVAVGQTTPADALESWMGSPGHRQNILDPRFSELGTGYAIDAHGRPYYVQVFGTPAS
jgi:uncharacterized protein YkwD